MTTESKNMSSSCFIDDLLADQTFDEIAKPIEPMPDEQR
jgi:hypothetical protein